MFRPAIILAAAVGWAAHAVEPVGRLGDDRFHTGNATLALTSDGARVVTVAQGRIVRTWDTATGRLLATSLLPGGPPRVPKLSADGRLLLRDLSFHDVGVGYEVWDLASNKLLRIIRPTTGNFDRVAFAGDGKTIAISEEGRGGKRCPFHIFLWDLTTGASRSLAGAATSDFGVYDGLALNADGSRLVAFGSAGWLLCWDVATGKQVWKERSPRGVVDLLLHPTGRTLVVCESEKGSLRWIDMATGKTQKPRHAPPVGFLNPMRYSPDGRKLLLNVDDWTGVFEPDTGRVQRLEGPGLTNREDVVFSADGKAVFGIASSRLQRWDAATGKATFPHSAAHESEVQLAFSPDGGRLASLSWNGVRLWDVVQKRMVHHWATEDCLSCPAFSPDGRRVVWKTRPKLRIHDAESGREIAGLLYDEHVRVEDNEVHAPQFSPDGRECTLLVPYSRNDYSHLLTWELTRPLAAPTVERVAGICRALSPDRRLLFEMNRGGLALAPALVCRGSDKFLELAAPTRPGGKIELQTEAVFSPDGRFIALPVTRDRPRGDEIAPHDFVAVCIFECITGNLVAVIPMSGPGYPMPPMAFDGPGRILAIAAGDGLRRWDLAAGKEMDRVSVNLPWAVAGERPFAESLAVSPHGRLAATGHFDGSILLWDLPAPPKVNGDLQPLLADLRGKDAGKALAAIHRLAAQPERAVPNLRELLTAVRVPADAIVKPLIDDLDSPAFPKREAASRRLAKFGEDVEAHFRKALAANPSAERRRRLTVLLAGLDPFRPSAEVLAAVRAVAALEKAGTPEARAGLKECAAAGTTARVKREIEWALSRLR